MVKFSGIKAKEFYDRSNTIYSKLRNYLNDFHPVLSTETKTNIKKLLDALSSEIKELRI